MIKLKSSCVILLFCSLGRMATASISEANLNLLRKSVVRVEASQCSSAPRTGTGFVWHSRGTAVTALHVVNGCNKIQAHFEVQGVSRIAKISKVVKSADLALLVIEGAPDDSEPLQVTQIAPEVNGELTVLGYPLLIPRMSTTSLKLRFGGKQLKDIVPSSVRAELASVGSPSLDVDVTNIEGHLVPGLSGAPILDESAKVVAVADGGLENGTVGISWGMPYRYLSDLNASTESVAPMPSNAHLFSAESSVHTGGEEVACGGATFRKIRTLDFSQIMHSTDDPLGLSQLTAAGVAFGIDETQFAFDVYQDQESGAAFVTLSGKEVTDRNGRCVSQIDSNVHLEVQLRHVANQFEVQTVSLDFEAISTPTPPWQIDPMWSYAMPVPRFDGFLVRRKSLVKMIPNPTNPYMPWAQDGNSFETLAAKGSYFIGTTAIDTKWTPQILQTQQLCRMSSWNAQGCATVKEELRNWGAAVIAVHLTTFPIG